MAVGDLVNLKKYQDPVVAMHTAGTTIYLVTNSGELISYTISGGATATVAHLSMSDVSAIWADATYIYIGCKSGRLLRYTIATGVNAQIDKFDSPITALCVYTLLYVTLADGHMYSYALA